MFNFVFIHITFLVQNKTVVDDAVFFLGETTLSSKTIDNFIKPFYGFIFYCQLICSSVI